MDPISLTVAFKGLGMLLAIGGGIAIARYGFHLYKDGAGQGRDKAVIQFGTLKVTANSVGSIVMCTAFIWAYIGVLLSPKYEKTGDTTRIYSTVTPAGNLEAIAIQTPLPVSKTTKPKVDEYKALFDKAIAESNQGEAISYVSLGGKRAKVRPQNDLVLQSKSGNIIFSTQVEAEGKSAELQYTATVAKGSLVFVPTRTDPENSIRIFAGKDVKLFETPVEAPKASSPESQ